MTIKPTLTLGGIGPKLALMSLPYIILSLIVMIRFPGFADLKFLDTQLIRIAGFIWLGTGLIYWTTSAVYFLKHLKEGKLITSGPFALCRNPIYSSMIVFVIPSIGVIFHSGLILSIAVVLYIGFRISIHGETTLLRRLFGEEYDIYEKSVNEIFPFPPYLFTEKNKT
jgi:protein-S-isoprenylcysteine O-methyltransferase Ste14